MKQTILIVIVVVLFFIYFTQLDRPPVPIQSSITNSKDLYHLLQQVSSGDKVRLSGKCSINLYTQYTVPLSTKQMINNTLNDIFQSFQKTTGYGFRVQELGNVYEQIDSQGSKRYIVNATMYSTTNFFTARVILDIVELSGEVLVNSVQLDESSNKYLINRFDTVYQDQGVLFNQDTFQTNIGQLMDTQYRRTSNLISVNTSRLDDTQYPLQNVVSLSSILQQYYPANMSTESVDHFRTKGIEGQIEQFFPPNQATKPSPQYCDRLSGQQCLFHHGSSTTEYNQPFMGPGLFFNRSSYPKTGW